MNWRLSGTEGCSVITGREPEEMFSIAMKFCQSVSVNKHGEIVFSVENARLIIGNATALVAVLMSEGLVVKIFHPDPAKVLNEIYHPSSDDWVLFRDGCPIFLLDHEEKITYAVA